MNYSLKIIIIGESITLDHHSLDLILNWQKAQVPNSIIVHFMPEKPW